MSKIRSKDTGPEMQVRRMLHQMGYRYRVHQKKLPGSPDLVFPARRKVIFVHGCFWHQHKGCKRAYVPSTNMSYWMPKFRLTRERDQRALDNLIATGWDAIIVWECEITEIGVLKKHLIKFLEA